MVDLKNSITNNWNLGLLETVFEQDYINAIQKISWPAFDYEDLLVWRGETNGTFSVKSYYIVNLVDTTETPDSFSWIWKSNLHERIKKFLWRITVGVLPTRHVLANWIGRGQSNCIICGAELETIIHLFKECQGTNAIAFASKWRFCLDACDASTPQKVINMCFKL